VQRKLTLTARHRPKTSKDSGQTLIEFILLLAVLVSLSFGLLKGFNNTTATRWQAIIAMITSTDLDRPVRPALRGE